MGQRTNDPWSPNACGAIAPLLLRRLGGHVQALKVSSPRSMKGGQRGALTRTQLGSYPPVIMHARRRIVLELSPHELRYLVRLARRLRGAGHRMPPFDVAHVLSVCLTAGMAAVAKELEQATGTPLNARSDDSAGALPGV